MNAVCCLIITCCMCVCVCLRQWRPSSLRWRLRTTDTLWPSPASSASSAPPVLRWTREGERSLQHYDMTALLAQSITQLSARVSKWCNRFKSIWQKQTSEQVWPTAAHSVSIQHLHRHSKRVLVSVRDRITVPVSLLQWASMSLWPTSCWPRRLTEWKLLLCAPTSWTQACLKAARYGMSSKHPHSFLLIEWFRPRQEYSTKPGNIWTHQIPFNLLYICFKNASKVLHF